MRHRKHTFKIGKTSSHRKAMMANLLTSLFSHSRIKTTIVKAKELRRWADKMITCAKIGDLHNRRKAISVIRDIEAVRTLFDEVAPKFKNRQGGYTRIIKVNNRKGDNAELCYIELVEEEVSSKTKTALPAKEKNAAKEVVDAEAVEAKDETDNSANSSENKDKAE